MKKNVWFISSIILVETLYLFFFILKLKNDLIFDLVSFNFAILESLFIIFLIPFQLYNRDAQHTSNPKPLLKFRTLVKRSAWPIVIEPIKAGLVFLCYFISGFIVLTLLVQLAPGSLFKNLKLESLGSVSNIFKNSLCFYCTHCFCSSDYSLNSVSSHSFCDFL